MEVAPPLIGDPCSTRHGGATNGAGVPNRVRDPFLRPGIYFLHGCAFIGRAGISTILFDSSNALSSMRGGLEVPPDSRLADLFGGVATMVNM